MIDRSGTDSFVIKNALGAAVRCHRKNGLGGDDHVGWSERVELVPGPVEAEDEPLGRARCADINLGVGGIGC